MTLILNVLLPDIRISTKPIKGTISWVKVYSTAAAGDADT